MSILGPSDDKFGTFWGVQGYPWSPSWLCLWSGGPKFPKMTFPNSLWTFTVVYGDLQGGSHKSQSSYIQNPPIIELNHGVSCLLMLRMLSSWTTFTYCKNEPFFRITNAARTNDEKETCNHYSDNCSIRKTARVFIKRCCTICCAIWHCLQDGGFLINWCIINRKIPWNGCWKVSTQIKIDFHHPMRLVKSWF